MNNNIKFLWSKLLKKTLNPPAIRNSHIHNTSRVCSGCNIVNIELDKYSYIGNYCLVVNADIGSFCSIADYCYIGGAQHAIDWVSTSPVFHNGKNIMRKNFSYHIASEQKRTIIGNDVWIGSMCLIKDGIHIGDGAVIGMGSVVTKDVEPYTIVVGNPAKFIRKRFREDIIKGIEESRWWDLTEKELADISGYINNPEEFLKRLDEMKNVIK